jgi:hypothetical protein
MRVFEGQLVEAVQQRCFPDCRIEVWYSGNRDVGHRWQVTVNGIEKDLTQEEAELAVGGRRDDFKALFGK